MPRILTIALVAITLTGCGSGPALTDEERLTVAEARMNFANLVLDGSGYSESLDSLDKIIAIYRAKPDAIYDGETMRQVLVTAASDLDGYRPALADRLDRELGD